MIPKSRIQKLCHISMSVWFITVEQLTWFDFPDALELMQYFFLKTN